MIKKVSQVIKGIRTMDVILVVIAVALILFTREMICLYRETGGVPDALIQCFFGFLTGECGIMGLIKTTKEKRRNRDD